VVAPYVDPPETEGDRPRDRRRLAVLWRLLPLLRPHSARCLLALTTLCGASGITLVYPWAARQVVDVGMSGQTTGRLDAIVALMIGVFAVNATLGWLRHDSISGLGERVIADLRGLVFDRVLTLR
jgi:ATP-binding cassette subfamily B protein